MEDKIVPWWRRALSYALDGIRSGFGFFHRSAQSNAAIEPEIVAGNQENSEEEAELTRHSHTPKPILETVSEFGSAQVLETAVAVLTEPETEVEEVVLVAESAEESAGTALFSSTVAEETLPEAALIEEQIVVAETLSEVASGEEAVLPQIEYPIDAFDRTPEFEDAPEAELEVESEPEAEYKIDADPEPDIAAEITRDPALESDPEPEENAIAEPEAPTAIVEHPTAQGPTPEPAAASEELIDPANEATLEQTVVLTAEAEIESVDEAAPATGSAPVAEQATEQATETFPEPATMPMDLIDPIPEQDSESTHEDSPDPVVPVETHIEAPVVALAPEPAQDPATSRVAELPAASAEEPAPSPAHAPKPFIKLESRDNEADLSPFSVVVSQVYDGPLDLLLDLIRKQDIDIYDIPIARITSQFLAYVNQLKATDVDVAGEFIYTASLLIHIKSKMLLPRAPVGPDDAAEDPRRELVERLLEHERFKNAAQMLQQKQMLEAATWSNPGLREFQDDASAEPEIAADTVDLVRIFRDILERARNRPVINVQEDSVTVGQMIQFLSRRLTMEDKPVALRRLLSHTRSERALIAMFLALLELVRLQAILLRQDRAFSEIFIKKHIGFEAVMNDGLVNARDDWR